MKTLLKVILVSFPLLLAAHPGQCQDYPHWLDSSNHYKVWFVDPVTVDYNVSVDDQFLPRLTDVELQQIDYFSNPAVKYEEPRVDTTLHLTWYLIDDTIPNTFVKYRNQFGNDSAFIRHLEYLLVWTKKGNLPKPDTLYHYLCYRLWKDIIDTQVVLFDQFDTIPETTDWIRPKYFCAPCYKKHNTNEYVPRDSSTHYVAYEIEPTPITHSITTLDQFGSHGLDIMWSEMLMVPTEKTKKSQFLPTLTTWGLILLLALLLGTGLWIILRRRRGRSVPV